MPTFTIDRTKCKRCARALRAGRGMIKKGGDGYYEIVRNPQNDMEVACLQRACEMCPFGAITQK
ncbi:ferredoxin [Nitratiruptor sp. YY09-18]|uniref:ferredoxin n=1 Tax=Nitratiruptor sp. YY09-18 TaxID=2724901 RepID=UPI0019154D73|nr:ferredoxin [Nitratiruptor sp. YY09-18]BCD68704.1 hypothetical protein NitYY0918_C1621 [Nitratiruptor sp. YY09-18]